jgi:hypothetical protein
MFDARTRGLLVALLYPVQFESRPELGVAQVIGRVVERKALGATPFDYLRAIEIALRSDDAELAGIIPQSHDGATVRSFLQRLSQSFAIATPPQGAAGPRVRT